MEKLKLEVGGKYFWEWNRTNKSGTKYSYLT